MSSNKPFRMTMLISFMGHCIILAMPMLNMPIHKPDEVQDISLNVEIEKHELLPKVKELGDEKKLKKQEVDIEKIYEPDDEDKEGIFSDRKIVKPDVPKEKIEVLEPDDRLVFRYQDTVKRKIQESRRYPSWAKKQEYEGIVDLAFTVFSNGDAKGIVIVNSSGFNILDEEALNTIMRASPFLPFPDRINRAFLEMEVSIVFRLE